MTNRKTKFIMRSHREVVRRRTCRVCRKSIEVRQLTKTNTVWRTGPKAGDWGLPMPQTRMKYSRPLVLAFRRPSAQQSIDLRPQGWVWNQTSTPILNQSTAAHSSSGLQNTPFGKSSQNRFNPTYSTLLRYSRSLASSLRPQHRHQVSSQLSTFTPRSRALPWRRKSPFATIMNRNYSKITGRAPSSWLTWNRRRMPFSQGTVCFLGHSQRETIPIRIRKIWVLED